MSTAPDPLPTLDRAGLKRLVWDFYADVRRDPELGPVFEAVIGPEWDEHLERMVEFWSTLMLGTRSFKGNVFARHVSLAKTAKIQPTDFLRWLTLWHTHTTSLFGTTAIASDLQRAAQGVGRSLFHGMFQEHARFVIEDGVATGYVVAA